MPVQLPPNFPSYDTSLSLLQKRKIWDSFSDLQPYIEDYYIVHSQCLAIEGNYKDISAYIFLKDCSNLKNISTECKEDWKIELSFLTRQNVPFIILPMPAYLIKQIYPKDNTIHLGGSIKCFHDSIQDILITSQSFSKRS